MKSESINKTQSQRLKYPVGVTVIKGKIALFFKNYYLGKSGLYLTTGEESVNLIDPEMKNVTIFLKRKEENIDQLEHVNVSHCDKGYFMTYIQKGERKDCLMGALSKGLEFFFVIGEVRAAQKRGTLVSNYKCDDQYVIYMGEGSIRTAISKDLEKWEISDVSCLTPRSSSFDHAPLTVLMVSLTPHGLLVVYDASYKENGKQTLQVGGALFSLPDPNDLIWRSETPLWDTSLPAGSEEMHSVGAVFYQDQIFLYYASETGKLETISIPQPFPPVTAKKTFGRLKRFYKNPIIIPNATNEWESEATFNPAALYDDGKVHLLYRAVGKRGLSCLGYASTKDGFHIEETLPEPAYVPRKEFEGAYTKSAQCTDFYKSGYGWGGCEDPKLTAIDDKIYLTYVAHPGYSEPRIALSSIKRSDFLQKKWDWEEPVLISPPGIIDKSGCILPEKVKGKYVIFHRIFPHILIDYRDELRFDGGRWLEAKHKIATRPSMWDSRKLSVGATPIKTETGWLVIYHAIDDRDDMRYKVGAMILDLEDPSKVLFRTNNPILEPDAHYENEGKPGIVYPCGAVVLGKELFVYYGGGDRVVCCATVQLDELIDDVKKDRPVSCKLREVVYS